MNSNPKGEFRSIPPGPFFITIEENSVASHRITLPVPIRKGLIPVPEQPELVWLRNDSQNCLQLHPAPLLYAIIEERIAQLPEGERPEMRSALYRDFGVLEVNKDFRLTLPKLVDLPTSFAWEKCQRAVIVGLGRYALLYSEIAYNRCIAVEEAAGNLARLFQEIS